LTPIPLTDAQAKQAIDAEQSYQAWWDAWRKSREFAGGMHWKAVAGKEYLYKTHDRKGNAKSLGVRSAATEAMAAEFHARKQESASRLKVLSESLRTQERVNAALRVGSAPGIVAQLCLKLAQTGLMGKSLMVVGTNSLYAYEAMAGVRFAREVMATTDIDLLWSHKAKLAFSTLDDTEAASDLGLMGILQKVDKSFKRLDLQHFRAANDQGYLVDLIRQMPEPPWKDEPERIGGEQDLKATDIWNMKWLLNAPRVQALAIAINGTVFPITAPDPRAYCAFKYWLSQSDERNPQKKPRDLAQAKAVYAVIEEKLPHLNKDWFELRSIPRDVLKPIVAGVLRS
jgi:hypothetical protein